MIRIQRVGPKCFCLIMLLGLMSGLAACVKQNNHHAYRDTYPEPCTQPWFEEIDREIYANTPEHGHLTPGSDQWLVAIDKKLAISDSDQLNAEIGDLEWCHQVHQALIGL